MAAASPPIQYSDPEIEPYTNELFNQCPRLRVLVVGKSGVGKSTLINKFFGVKLANVAHNERGFADINNEIVSNTNERFVLHDSQGLEPGETENLSTLMKFIQDRQNRQNLSEKLHAIWVCIQSPFSGGRILESSTEKLLKLSLQRQVPMIVIFTKFDLLVNEKGDDVPDTVEDENEFKAKAKELAEADFETYCVRPIKELLGSNKIPPLVKVSEKKGYEDTLLNLTNITERHITNSFITLQRMEREAVSVTFATAQALNLDKKVEASINVGKSKYWKGLASSTRFPGLSLASCLTILHQDIVKVWNYPDPDSYLSLGPFIEKMSTFVNDLSGRHRSVPPPNTLKAAAGIIGTVAGVAGAVFPPTAPIVVPTIFFALTLAAWLFTVYKATPYVLQRLMGYIVDLINIMRGLFYRLSQQDGREGPIKDVVDTVLESYGRWDRVTTLHEEIHAFTQRGNVFDVAAHKDHAFDKLLELIKKYEFKGTS